MGTRYRELFERRRAEEKRQRKAEKQERKRNRFVGWWRPDPKTNWKKIIHGDDETKVLNRLLDVSKGGDKIVLRAGENPNRSRT